MSKRITVKEAQQARESLKAHYSSIDFQKAPTVGVDSGAGGKLKELSLALENSRKNGVSTVGQKDCHLRWWNGEKVVIRPFESKTNGGRLGSVYNSNPDSLIIYSINMNNSNTNYQSRIAENRLFTVAEFIELAERTGAVKMSSKEPIEPQLAPTKKAFWEAIRDWDRVYTVGEVVNWE